MKWIQRKQKTKPRNNDDIIDKIAKIRGIEDVDTFLNPSKNVLHDPYLMKNIKEASNRIIQAIKNNERILASYDPDADGISATTVMLKWLSNYTENVDYIYGERNDGHGINEQTRLDFVGKDSVIDGDLIEDLEPEEKERRFKLNSENLNKIENADLLILIDSSSNDVEACKKLKEINKNLDIIILDHHEIERNNPHVLMVNPQQEGCNYPNKFLSGAGVVFKTLQVAEDTLGQVDVWQYIDLVAVGMYADVMKLDVMENRYLIMQGLRNIKNVGLIRILKGAKADFFRLNGDSIGFSIAPMINGVARMNNIKLAIDILLEDDDNVCKKIRLQMHKLNEKRKQIQKETIERYSKSINSEQKVLMVFDNESSKGFNGLVAQNLSEKYRRPVIVGRLHNGVISGSFRSYNGFKFKSFLQEFANRVDLSGFKFEALGHEGAGGIVISENLLNDLNLYIDAEMPTLSEKEPSIIYDLEIDVNEIHEYINPLEQFNMLTGNGFPKVLVKVDNITIEEISCIGKTEETVKFKTFDNLELIKFRVDKNYASELSIFNTISAIGQLQMNIFYNFKTKVTTKTPQIMIDDYKVC